MSMNDQQVENLHRQMTQSSMDVADLDRKLQDLREDGPGLDQALRGWSDAARDLLLNFEGCEGQLISELARNKLTPKSLKHVRTMLQRKNVLLGSGQVAQILAAD